MDAIVEMLAHTDGPSIEFGSAVSLTREMTQKAYDYWLAARGNRPWPARKDITPQGMKEFVRHIGLVEVRRDKEGRPSYFVRLAGAKIESVYGPITGKSLGEFLPAGLEGRWRLVFDAALTRKEPFQVTTRVMFGGKTYLQAEVLLAPLGEGDEISMLFAAVDVWPAVGGEAPLPAKASR
ncbi:MAG: PAS domain-containing protein [Rhizomicrobium sp.]